MAWNPSPEVQVARDAASSMAKISGVGIDRVIVIYTRKDGRVGYASYGETKVLCAETRRLADALFARLMKWFQERLFFLHSPVSAARATPH